MRIVHSRMKLEEALKSARAEAEQAFGSGEVYLEKLIDHPRPIEVQILADHHGHCVSLGERESSVQRRRQKVIEEAPSPIVDEDLRTRMGEARSAWLKRQDIRMWELSSFCWIRSATSIFLK